jgi:hypothetical protein
MSDEKKYYCFCSSNCKYETMTKEQILAAIAQATGVTNVDPDAGFISKVKETNGGQYVTFWVGTQAQYNAIGTKETNCLYIITDETSREDFNRTMAGLYAKCEQAIALAGVKREASKHVEDLEAASSLTITEGNRALFYIVEIINATNNDNMTERYTITLDYYQLISGNAYYIPNLPNVMLIGSVDNKQVTIRIINIGAENNTGYRLTRFVGYC